MPYKIKGKCVYRKDTGKKVGCTKGSVKKYITALRIATANESFKTFKQFFFESTQEELPPSAPYGFWIKYNEVITVRGGPGAHWNIGRVYLLKRGIDTNFVHEQMFKLGFVRCVFEVLNVDAGMDIEYKPGTTPRESIKKAETVAEYYKATPYVSAVRD